MIEGRALRARFYDERRFHDGDLQKLGVNQSLCKKSSGQSALLNVSVIEDLLFLSLTVVKFKIL